MQRRRCQRATLAALATKVARGVACHRRRRRGEGERCVLVRFDVEIGRGDLGAFPDGLEL